MSEASKLEEKEAPPRGESTGEKASLDGRLAVFHCNGGRLVRPDESVSGPGASAEWALAYLPCTGRVDLATVLSCFRKGACGVLLVGCPEGTCRFPHPDGECLAESLVTRAKRIVEMAGWDPARMRYAAAGDMDGVEREAREVMERLEELGAQPLSTAWDGDAASGDEASEDEGEVPRDQTTAPEGGDQ
jgi:coenzyme F420-reducing hydrogenase delta subunit